MKKSEIQELYLLLSDLPLLTEKIVIDMAMTFATGDTALIKKREELILKVRETKEEKDLLLLNTWIKKYLEYEPMLHKIRELNKQMSHDQSLNRPIITEREKIGKKAEKLKSELLKLKTGQD